MSEPWSQAGYVERYQKIYAPGPDEIEQHLSLLDLTPQDIFADFGCGAGQILTMAAPMVQHAIGIDPSPHQLAKSRRNLGSLSNVTLIQAGFLDCDLRPFGITKAASRKALHHLPDDQKQTFLFHLSEHLKPGGLFLLEDAMLAFEQTELTTCWAEILAKEAPRYYGNRWSDIRADFILSFEKEFPTSRRVLIAQLEMAGFTTERSTFFSRFYGNILARKKKQPPKAARGGGSTGFARGGGDASPYK